MTRQSKARRRFHTDRIVRNRRARFIRESSWWIDWTRENDIAWVGRRLSYGYLATTDPWDCGHPRCGCCHTRDYSWRAREKREWRLQVERGY